MDLLNLTDHPAVNEHFLKYGAGGLAVEDDRLHPTFARDHRMLQTRQGNRGNNRGFRSRVPGKNFFNLVRGRKHVAKTAKNNAAGNRKKTNKVALEKQLQNIRAVKRAAWEAQRGTQAAAAAGGSRRKTRRY